MAASGSAKFQLCTGTTWVNPWPMYQELRDHDPVHYVVPDGGPAHDYYVLSRHSDVWSAAQDNESFTSAHGWSVDYHGNKPTGSPDDSPTPIAPRDLLVPRPVHAGLRKVLGRGFEPQQAQVVEPGVRRFVIERVERLRANGGGDIVAELLKPLPSIVVAHYLGVPESDRRQFDDWSEAVVTMDGGTTNAADLESVIASMTDYFTGLIKRRRSEPTDDTVSQLVATGVGDDAPGRLQLLDFIFTMVIVGNGAVTGMLGGAIQLLHQWPDQRRLLADNPAIIPNAVEELLRLTTPVQGLARTTTCDITMHGTTIPAGRKVLLLYASGNRDERQYGPDAGDLDVTRGPRNALSFGLGAHHCLGAFVSRMQSQVVLAELLARCPDFGIDEAGIVWADGSYVRRPLSMPFTARS